MVMAPQVCKMIPVIMADASLNRQLELLHPVKVHTHHLAVYQVYLMSYPVPVVIVAVTMTVNLILLNF